VLGLINGLFVVLLELPSLAVTLGTMGAYTGVAFLILKGNAIVNFPTGLVKLGSGTIGGTQLETSTTVVLGLAIALAFVVHCTSFGRALFAVGSGRQAALFSGIAVVRTRLTAFVIAGVFAGIAAVFYLGNYDTAQATIANDQLLPAITAVILGGVSAYGGTGSIPGVAVAVILLALLQGALGLAGVSGQAQTVAVGALLIIAIGAGTVIGAVSRLRRPARASGAQEEAAPG
jgi:rhamnose transport system permease protein